MDTTFADRQIRKQELARACVRLGASPSTVQRVTGMGRAELERLFFNGEERPKSGKRPYARDWLARSNRIVAVHASVFYAAYDDNRKHHFTPAESLVGACDTYRQRFAKHPRLTFDRAWRIVQQTEGVWSDTKDPIRSFLVVCQACRSKYLTANGQRVDTSLDCPFCKLEQRCNEDYRVRAGLLDQPELPKKCLA